MPNWDDLRFLLSLRREGSLGAAARALGVDPSTVSRRIAALETGLGVQLLTRTPAGAELNDAGAQASDAALAMDAIVEGLVARIGGGDLRPAGVVKVAVTDGFAGTLYRGLAGLRETHPDVCVELVISSRTADLANREADLAIRLFRDPKPDLVARRVAELGWSLYAADAYVERRGAPTASDLCRHDLIGFADAAARSPGAAWLDAHARGAKIVFRGGTISAALSAVRAGMGVALLPCFSTAGETSLQRLSPVLARSECFLVALPDPLETARVRVVWDALATLFEAQRDVLSGER